MTDSDTTRATRRQASAMVASALLASVLAVGAVGGAKPALAVLGSVAEGWNNEQIAWFDYEDGLAEAKKSGKPILLIAHTSWCPHCKRFQPLFRDARVVEAAKQFVMVMIDRDLEKELNAKIGPNGQTFVPRTVALTSTGEVRADVTGASREHPNFISYRDTRELLAFMAAAARPTAGR